MDEMEYEMHPPPEPPRQLLQMSYTATRCPHFAQIMHDQAQSASRMYDPVHPISGQVPFHHPWAQLPAPHPMQHRFLPGHSIVPPPVEPQPRQQPEHHPQYEQPAQHQRSSNVARAFLPQMPHMSLSSQESPQASQENMRREFLHGALESAGAGDSVTRDVMDASTTREAQLRGPVADQHLPASRQAGHFVFPHHAVYADNVWSSPLHSPPHQQQQQQQPARQQADQLGTEPEQQRVSQSPSPINRQQIPSLFRTGQGPEFRAPNWSGATTRPDAERPVGPRTSTARGNERGQQAQVRQLTMQVVDGASASQPGQQIQQRTMVVVDGTPTSVPAAGRPAEPSAVPAMALNPPNPANPPNPGNPPTRGGPTFSAVASERQRALRALQHRRSGSSSGSGRAQSSTSSSDDDIDASTSLAEHQALRLFEHMSRADFPSTTVSPPVSPGERVRAQQLLRGALVNRRVASKNAISSLESVDIDSLDEGDKTCVICYNDFGTPTPEGINEAPLRLPKCKHIFGDHCIKKWFEESDSCPYCRDKVPSEPQFRATSQAIQQFVRAQHVANARREGISSGQFVIRFARADGSAGLNTTAAAPPAAGLPGGADRQATRNEPSASGAAGHTRSWAVGERRTLSDVQDDTRRRTRRRHGSFRATPAFTSANNGSDGGTGSAGRPNSFANSSTAAVPAQSPLFHPPHLQQQTSPYMPQFQPYHQTLAQQSVYGSGAAPNFSAYQQQQMMPSAAFQQFGAQESSPAHNSSGLANAPSRRPRFSAYSDRRARYYGYAIGPYEAPPEHPARGSAGSCPQVLQPPHIASTASAEDHSVFASPFSHHIAPIAHPGMPGTAPYGGSQLHGPPMAGNASLSLPPISGMDMQLATNDAPMDRSDIQPFW